ncbi:MAG: hypothetical protein AB7O96_08395 [Pseudobdellovibrionaceae bacterium]
MHQYHRIIRPQDKEFGQTTFKHEDIGLKGVTGRPFLDLGFLLSEEKFAELDFEIGVGIAKTRDAIPGGSVRGQIPPKLKNAFGGDLESEVMNNLSQLDPTGKHREAMRKMTRHERQKYCYMVLGSAPVWHQLLYVRNIAPTSGWEEIKPFWTKEGLELFPKVVEFAKTLPFKVLGRILIFCTYPYYPIPTHRDWIQIPHQDHHINVTSKLNRGIYVYDEKKDKKIYLPPEVRAYFFNLRDYHGVEAYPSYTYTLKFEGLFTDEFSQQIGLDEGYVWRNPPFER